MRITLLFVIINLLFFAPASGQTVISGKLLDEQQKPIANVTVSYKKVSAYAILGFAKTDAAGVFKLIFKTLESDSLQLDFNHLSYARRIVNVVNASANYAYVLKSEVRKLAEVKVADIPIYKRKDTINYNTAAFTSKQDRVIADIIKKLPGIEMQGDQILYQGKLIKKFMVNNLDLMEGRYAMINNNLPADAVKKIQIIENDQPIKILDSLVFSEQASLNLELKKLTNTGTGKLGVGFEPILWDLNLTPMTFGKTFQMLNSFQTNNVGNDVSKSLQSFYTGNNSFSDYGSISEGPSYIFIREVNSPGFDEKKWLDNKIFLFSSNVLQKLKSGIEVKGNISYFDDSRHRSGVTNTQYFTSQQVISNRESVDNSYRMHVFDAGAVIEKNEKEIYLRNMFKYHRRWNNEIGNLLFNSNNQIEQKRVYQDESFLNTLSIRKMLGKQLINVESNLFYDSTPQSLRVSPGQFQDILNQGIPYDEMEQNVTFKKFSWNNNLGFLRKIRSWRFTPKIAFNYNQTNLKTDIKTRQDDHIMRLDTGYFNDMHNSEFQLSMNLGVQWEKRKWKFFMSLPYNFFFYNVSQQDVKTLNNTFRNAFNPSANLTYLRNHKNQFSFNLSGGRQFGGLENFYNGYIISQYRSIQRYDARILQTDAKQTGLSYEYKNMSKGLFANGTYRYSHSKRYFMYTTNLDQQGLQTNSIVDRNSQSENHDLSAGASHLIFSLKTVLKINANLGWYRSDYLLNGSIDQQYVQSRTASFEMNSNYSTVISGEYRATIGQSISHFSAAQKNQLFYNNHYLNLVVYPGNKHAIMFYNSLYSNNIPGQGNQYFLDVNYRYRIEKWRTDIDLTFNNVINNVNYIQQYSNNYELVQSYFELRPRQFLIATRFKF